VDGVFYSRDDFSLEVALQLATQKGHNVFTIEAKRCMFNQIWVDFDLKSSRLLNPKFNPNSQIIAPL
jgi:hypothetical protein